MFGKLKAFFADLKVRCSDWRAGRIVTAEEAKANPERFVRQLIAYTKNGYLWFQDPKDKFAYESYYGKHIFCRIFVISKTFDFGASLTHHELQLLDPVTEEPVACNLAWQCFVMQDDGGEYVLTGNMKMRELFDLVAEQVS